MDNIDFNAYVTDVLRLVRTMVIKIEAIALRDNAVLEAAGVPVSSDKRTWRYYMNLNGDYHPTDEIMTIKSIDTGDEIVFNKENLITHMATYREYSAGGYWFNRLVERYPGQADLVRGIVAPIPYEETIPADDYKILKYNTNLVLWNEDQLIPQTQQWIYSVVDQLFKHEYLHTDNLMLTLNVIQFYADLIKAICTIRHEAIGTRYVHDFYIWARIDSYGDFSKYKSSLSKYQTMWLYRNIPWLKNNPGLQYTFNLLMENLLTEASIPLAKYDMIENTGTQVEDLTPTPQYRKLQLNLLDEYGRTPSFIDTEALIRKQQPLAKENYDQSAIWFDDALKRGRYSLHSELPTKALESKMADYTNRHINTKMSVVFNEWIYLTAKGYFKGRILVTDPKTGKQVRLPVGDAYYVWRYLIDWSRGQDNLEICPAYYQNVLKVNPPSIDELIAIGGKDFITPVMAYDIRNIWRPVQIFIAPEYLMQYSDDVYGLMWQHTKLYAQFYDLNKRARVRHATELMYESGVATLTEFTDYTRLLQNYEFDFTDYTPEESRNFAWEIFKRITGWDSNSNPSLRIRQNALIDIMMQLSSYTIHTIREMDDGTDLTELQNETFVGDARTIGQGNGSYGDFSAVQMAVQSHLEGMRTVESLMDLVDHSAPKSVMESESVAIGRGDDVFKPVDLSNNLLDYAVRIQDNSYIRVIPVEKEPIPATKLGRLEYPDLNGHVPPTRYGRLNYPPGFAHLPATHYGRLEYPVHMVRVPPTKYGRLVYPEIKHFAYIPPTEYGRLVYAVDVSGGHRG